MAEKTVEQRCYEALKARGVTFAAAESCTGRPHCQAHHGCAGRVGRLPWGGIVSYTNIVKHRVLGVPADMLEEYGAVSAPVARAMAEGARKRRTADAPSASRASLDPTATSGEIPSARYSSDFRRPRRRSPSALTSARLPARKFAGKRRMKPSKLLEEKLKEA